MNPLYPDVAERADKRCEYCRAPERAFNFAFEIEHIQPRSAGGDDSPENLALACTSCNSFKATAAVGWDQETEQTVPLFHPRRDQWGDHFHFAGETGLVQGTTPMGRATVRRLKINSEAQVRARRQWAQMGLYQ